MTSKTGILLTNTGTPDAPTTSAVRRYLREFLSDRRIVQLPRIIWLPILYGLVLTTRPKKSAQLYKHIWGKTDSPMREFMTSLRNKLSNALSQPVEIGMNYGNPSIQQGLEQLRQQGADNIIVIPLYPQYSHTTTASSIDRIITYKHQTAISYIDHYADLPAYITALANSVRHAWQTRQPAQRLLISFHGIPESFVTNGDPYQSQCETTARLLAAELQLPPEKWTLCYQSQFGYAKWLKPATFDLLAELPQQGIQDIDIICPGFAVDCLETLEEIALRGREVFMEAGGRNFHYIPALNDSDEQVRVLEKALTLFPKAC